MIFILVEAELTIYLYNNENPCCQFNEGESNHGCMEFNKGLAPS